jgi:hypothetical protein
MVDADRSDEESGPNSLKEAESGSRSLKEADTGFEAKGPKVSLKEDEMGP